MSSGYPTCMTQIDALVAAVAGRQHGVFDTSQIPLLTKHTVHHRTRTGRWRHASERILIIEGSPSTWEQRLWIALLTAGPGSAVGRRSAARLHGLAGAKPNHVDIVQPETTVPMGKPRSSRRTSSLPPHHYTEAAGFPSTTIERTLFDLAGLTSPQRRRRGWTYLPEQKVARMVDDALVAKQTSIHALSAVFSDLAQRGRPGTRVMRQLLAERSEGYVATESELEDLFVRFLDAHELPQPRRQASLGSNTEQIGRVDFVYDAPRLIVELDGAKYHSQLTRMRHDKVRDLEFLAAGWQSIRIDWWLLINDAHRLAQHLHTILDSKPHSDST